MRQATLFESTAVYVALRCPTCGRTMTVRRATWRRADCGHGGTQHDVTRFKSKRIATMIEVDE